MRPATTAARKAGSGNQLPLSFIDVCRRSIATWEMRRSWSIDVSPEYTEWNFAAAW